jgi:hypothetical protein
MKQTTCRFKLTSRTSAGDGQSSLVFDPDYADDRNKEWAKYTPGGQLKLTVLDEVAEAFEPGTAYELLIRPTGE